MESSVAFPRRRQHVRKISSPMPVHHYYLVLPKVINRKPKVLPLRPSIASLSDKWTRGNTGKDSFMIAEMKTDEGWDKLTSDEDDNRQSSH